MDRFIERSRKIYEDQHVAVAPYESRGKIYALLYSSNSPNQTVNRAFSDSVLSGLEAIAKSDQKFEGIVMYGPPGDHFGGDLEEFARGGEDIEKLMENGVKINEKLRSFSRDRTPAVSILAGGAYFGGSALGAMFQDYCIVGDKSRISLPEPELGLTTAGWNGPINLMMKSGSLNAEVLLKTGRMINAQEMYETGLADRVVTLDCQTPKRREFDNDCLYQTALKEYHQETIETLMPAAFELLSNGIKRGWDKLTNLFGREELDEEVSKRLDQRNYIGLVGMKLQDARDKLKRIGGPPLSRNAIDAYDEFFALYRNLTQDQLEEEFVEISKYLSEQNSSCLDHPDASEGIRARLGRYIPRFE